MSDTAEEYVQLPKGMRIFCNLPAGVTAHEFSEWLYERGLVVPEAAITLRSYPGNTSAIFVVDREELIRLLMWVINGERFKGFQLTLRSKPNHHGGQPRGKAEAPKALNTRYPLR
jgi:hypothetical protein